MRVLKILISSLIGTAIVTIISGCAISAKPVASSGAMFTVTSGNGVGSASGTRLVYLK